jgi:hypothetical protein
LAMVGAALPVVGQSAFKSSTMPLAMEADQTDAAGGGFWEFIHKLSGPEFISDPAKSFTLALWFDCLGKRSLSTPCNPHLAFRYSYAVLDATDDSDDAVGDSVGLHMITNQLTVEWEALDKKLGPLQATLGPAVGISSHRFRGRAFESFDQLSFPLFAHGSLAYGVLAFRAGIGWRAFQEFDQADFRRVVKVGDGMEFVRFEYLGLELRLPF